MRTTLRPEDLLDQAAQLRRANLAFAARFPGGSGRRQPVHTVYLGAQHFRSDAAPGLGAAALRALDEHAPDAATFAEALGLPPGPLAETVHARVREKLGREPVEDLRVDFEDGYGVRPDAEEDGHAVSVAREVTRGMAGGTLPPFVGIRVKTLSEELRGRSVRTLDLFLTALLGETGGALPPEFVVTLPKVVSADQVEFFVDVLRLLEDRLGLGRGALRFEVMVEAPQAVVSPEGGSLLPRVLDAGEGRITGAHFGTYDYTAALGITAAHQRLRHPACDFARHVMQVALAGTGVRLSDGSTAELPVPVHGGPSLTEGQRRENREAVHRAWRTHFEDVRHSLVHGFYQGWDLHSAQLPTRFAAVFAFFLAGRDAAAQRLRGFLARAAQAGGALDDPHAGQALLDQLLRGLGCGAFTEAEVLEATGLTADELRGRSFPGIHAGRQQGRVDTSAGA